MHLQKFDPAGDYVRRYVPELRRELNVGNKVSDA